MIHSVQAQQRVVLVGAVEVARHLAIVHVKAQVAAVAATDAEAVVKVHAIVHALVHAMKIVLMSVLVGVV